MTRTLLTALAATTLLASCGQSSTPSSAQSAEAGKPESASASKSGNGVTLTFVELDGSKRSTMAMGGCTVVYEATNKLKDEIKYLTFDYRAVPAEDDVNARSFVNTRGDLRIYFGGLKPGETRQGSTTLEGLNCDSIAGLAVSTKSCGLKSGSKCEDAIRLDNKTGVPLDTTF